MTADKEVVNDLAGAQQQTLTKLLFTGLPRRLSSSRKRCRSELQRPLGSSSLHSLWQKLFFAQYQNQRMTSEQALARSTRSFGGSGHLEAPFPCVATFARIVGI